MDIKDKVYELIKKTTSVSYVDLEHYFDEIGFEWRGDLAMMSENYENIVYWSGWNESALNVLSELLAEGWIVGNGASQLIYQIDGKGLNMPVAKSQRNYKHPRWQPIAFDVTE